MEMNNINGEGGKKINDGKNSKAFFLPSTDGLRNS